VKCTVGAVPRQPQACDIRVAADDDDQASFGGYEPAYLVCCYTPPEPVMLDIFRDPSSSLCLLGHMLLSQDRDTTFALDFT
jgi:hypothetical protein